MANEKRLIDADELLAYLRNEKEEYEKYGYVEQAAAEAIGDIIAEIEKSPSVDAVEVPDKELLKAIKLLIKQYGHSKASEYVHSPVAHALFHTWKQVDERR